jgi:hypothetical protein
VAPQSPTPNPPRHGKHVLGLAWNRARARSGWAPRRGLRWFDRRGYRWRRLPEGPRRPGGRLTRLIAVVLPTAASFNVGRAASHHRLT